MMKRLFPFAVVLGAIVTCATTAEAGHGHRNHFHCWGNNFNSYYGGFTPYSHRHRIWHDTSHYDYHPGGFERHRNHYHYVPGHYDFHQTGHWDHYWHR